MAETDWKYLQYNVETGQKRTGDGPSGGASSLSDLDDTSISSPSDGQMLGYDETEGKWKNVAAPGGNVDDVEVNGVSVVNSQKVAEIKSYKEVTQAQYEALPDTKLSDGILYAIKDGGQAVDGFPPLIYSDEEREVGVWRDGKTIYQKAFVFSNSLIISNTAWTSIGILASSINAESYIRCFALSETGTLLDAMNVATIDSYIALTSWRNGDTIAVKTVVIQYTKTTDTPGSGTWTIQGALAHHYSTEEHIIGTWIDGKPLYEKTVYCGDFTGSGNKEIAHNISNLGRVVKMFGAFNEGTTRFPLPIVMWGSAVTYQTRLAVTDTNIIISRDTAAQSVNIYVTLQYTKTTD